MDNSTQKSAIKVALISAVALIITSIIESFSNHNPALNIGFVGNSTEPTYKDRTNVKKVPATPVATPKKLPDKTHPLVGKIPDRQHDSIAIKLCSSICDTKGIAGVKVSFADAHTNKIYSEVSDGKNDMVFEIPCYLRDQFVSVKFEVNGKTDYRDFELKNLEIPDLFKTRQ